MGLLKLTGLAFPNPKILIGVLVVWYPFKCPKASKGGKGCNFHNLKVGIGKAILKLNLALQGVTSQIPNEFKSVRFSVF